MSRISFKDFSMPNPIATTSAIKEAHHSIYYRFPDERVKSEEVVLKKKDVLLLNQAAEAYLHFTTHESGTERMIRQLREVRRVFKNLYFN